MIAATPDNAASTQKGISMRHIAAIVLASALALTATACKPTLVPTCPFNDAACIRNVMGY